VSNDLIAINLKLEEVMHKLVITLIGFFLLSFTPLEASLIVVPGMSNIFGAGHSTPPGGGILPPSYTFLPGSNLILTFDSVTGVVSYNSGGNYYGPDGLFGYGDGGTNITSTGGISGITYAGSPHAMMFLIGVFLNDSEPADPAPNRLDFSPSGLNENFTELYPELRQTFFVGDGLTGTGSGVIQVFHVPATATRLYFGFADGYDFQGLPRYYGDNIGAITASFNMASASTPVPEPATMLLMVFGSGLMGVGIKRLRKKKG
jgi:hypothetical protein